MSLATTLNAHDVRSLAFITNSVHVYISFGILLQYCLHQNVEFSGNLCVRT